MLRRRTSTTVTTPPSWTVHVAPTRIFKYEHIYISTCIRKRKFSSLFCVLVTKEYMFFFHIFSSRFDIHYRIWPIYLSQYSFFYGDLYAKIETKCLFFGTMYDFEICAFSVLHIKIIQHRILELKWKNKIYSDMRIEFTWTFWYSRILILFIYQHEWELLPIFLYLTEVVIKIENLVN